MSDYDSNSGKLTIDDVLSMAAKGGISFSPEELSEAALQNEAYSNTLPTESEVKNWMGQFVEWFNAFYPRFLKTLLGMGEVLVTAAHTILIAFGIPAILVVLMIVEQTRVYYGALLIDPRPDLASWIAWVLVAANLMAEMIIHWEEDRKHWQAPPRYEFSLRLWWQRITYVLGFRAEGWQPTVKSPAFWARIVLRLITITILMLAISGSMQNAMDTTQGNNWINAVMLILTKSSLSQMITWIGGLMLAVTLVTAAQGFSQYIAKKVIEITAVMQFETEDQARKVAESAGIGAAYYLMARFKEKQRQQRKGQALVSPLDTHEIAVYSGSINVPNVSMFQKQLAPAVEIALKKRQADRSLDKLSVREAAKKAGVSTASMQRARQVEL